MSKPTTAEGQIATEYQSYLDIYVVWHPLLAEGQKIAEQIYSHFNRDVNDPMSRGLGIPVYFRSAEASPGSQLPPTVQLNRAQRCAIIVLVDAKMTLDDKWTQYVQSHYEETEKSHGAHRTFPVSMSRAALDAGILSPPNFIRYHTFEDDQKVQQLLIWLTHELGRFLGRPRTNNANVEQSPAPVKIFISHAKQDGLDLATKLRSAISETPSDHFFDKFDIAPGYAFTKEIEANISSSVLLVLQSDAYSSRPWCRREVLMAKQLQCPIVVVNALERNETRSFPYLGNVPVIRWTGSNQREVIGLALLEYLRFSYTRLRIEILRQTQKIAPETQVFIRSPELLDCRELVCHRSGEGQPKKLIVYPDPPLGVEELDSLSAFCPDVRFVTPTTPAENKFLAGRIIGLSLSTSPDLARLGFGEMHLRDAMIEFARHLLARGANISYGGLFDTGFTKALFELVEAHNAVGITQYGPVQNFLAWPYYRDIDPEREAQLRKVSRLNRVAIPQDVASEFGIREETQLKVEGAQEQYILARCLTEMRAAMSKVIAARLVMGGKTGDYSGKYPGIFEEAYLTLRDGKPLFLLGAFGGCARAVIDLLQGRQPEALTQHFQVRNPKYASLVQEYNKQSDAHPELDLEKIDYERMADFFRAKGMSGLNNKLTEAENLRLFEAVDFDEIIYLILTGLSRWSATD